jgi:iron(III) transport system permease protein
MRALAVRRSWASSLGWIVVALVVVLIVLVPLVYTIDAAFYKETKIGLSPERSLQAVINVYTSWEYLETLWEAVRLAVIVTAFSLLLGVLMAMLVCRTDLPFKRTLETLIIMPLFLSPFTGLIAWIALGSEKTGFVNAAWRAVAGTIFDQPPALANIWTYGGVVWVMTLFFAPFAYLFTAGSLRKVDSSLEEAARVSGASAWTTLARITLPISLPSVFAAGLLIFILAAEMYTIPGIIGTTAGFTTMPWKIYLDSTQFPVHRAHAAASGTILLFVTIAGVWMQRRVTRVSERYVTVSGKGFRGNPLKLGRVGTSIALALIAFYVLCADLLPFGALILSSFMKFSAATITPEVLTLDQYRDIFQIENVRTALVNTVVLGLMSGAVCLLLGFAISYAEIRSPGPATRALSFLGVLPVAVPGLVFGIGLVWTYLQTPLYGTIWILLFAYVAKFLPYGILVSHSGILQIHSDLEASARMSGAGPVQAMLRITIPLIKPTLIAVFFFVMLMSIKELSASILLYSDRSQVLSVLTWHYMDAGNYQFAAAVGVVQTVLMLLLVIGTRAIFDVGLERALGKGGA